MKRIVTIAGLMVGLILSCSACSSPKQKDVAVKARATASSNSSGTGVAHMAPFPCGYPGTLILTVDGKVYADQNAGSVPINVTQSHVLSVTLMGGHSRIADVRAYAYPGGKVDISPFYDNDSSVLASAIPLLNERTAANIVTFSLSASTQLSKAFAAGDFLLFVFSEVPEAASCGSSTSSVQLQIST